MDYGIIGGDMMRMESRRGNRKASKNVKMEKTEGILFRKVVAV